MRRRLRGGPVLLAAIALATACSVSDSPFPATGSLFATLRATGLGTQASAVATLQYVRWEIARLDGLVGDPPLTHTFVSTPPCIVAATPVGDADVRRCFGSGLSLEAGPTLDVTFQLHVTRLDGIAAIRPDLPDTGDYDGDGVPNASDNCKLVWNPPVPDDDGTLVQPKTCYVSDGTLPDQDGDLLPDTIDNCVWFRTEPDDTSALADANANGIGDACEQTIPATLPAGGLFLECEGTFTVAGSTVSRFAFDFTPALTCDVSAGTCQLAVPSVDQASAIELVGPDVVTRVACTRRDVPSL